MVRKINCSFTKHLFVFFCAASLSVSLFAQTGSPSKTQQASSNTYENDEVVIPIPADWTRKPEKHPALNSYHEQDAIAASNSVLQAKGKLLLAKDGYTLALAYRTEHASGIRGGRFIEAFNIPWLAVDQAWTCSLHLTQVPQSASRTLLFNNILIDAEKPGVRAKCGLPETFSQRITAFETGCEELIGRRWFAGYFATNDGGWFFDESADASCGCKMFSLTTSATKPDQLPIPEDSHLQEIIQEAINIVNSIHYKRCSPGLSSPFRHYL